MITYWLYDSETGACLTTVRESVGQSANTIRGAAIGNAERYGMSPQDMTPAQLIRRLRYAKVQTYSDEAIGRQG